MNWKEEAFILLEQLVRVPSINPEDHGETSELFGEKAVGDKLLDYIKKYLPDFSCWQEEVLPNRFNCYASYKAGEDCPTILLETHLDTVGIQGMSIDPFTLKKESGRWYGRGACDAKGQIAAMVLGIRKAMMECGGQLPINILFAAVVDEEHKHRGVDFLVEHSVHADLAIVGEPTELQFAAFHKGSIRFEVNALGTSAHSSTPWEGVNAIEIMADVVQVLKTTAKQTVENRTHPLCGKSSISVTLIAGGEQVNMIPDTCSIHIDRRLNPQEDWEEAFNEIKNIVKQHVTDSVWANIRWNDPYLIDPPLTNNLTDKALVSLAEVMKQDRPEDVSYVGLPFGCDASKIQPVGIPTVVFGPGSILQAHTADEWIDEDSLLQAIEIYAKIFQNLKL